MEKIKWICDIKLNGYCNESRFNFKYRPITEPARSPEPAQYIKEDGLL